MSGAFGFDLTEVRTIPLPPPQGTGIVKFGRVFLSLAYDDLGLGTTPPTVRLRIVTGAGTARIDVFVPVPVGRRVVYEILPRDEVATVLIGEHAKLGGHTILETPIGVLVEYE